MRRGGGFFLSVGFTFQLIVRWVSWGCMIHSGIHATPAGRHVTKRVMHMIMTIPMIVRARLLFGVTSPNPVVEITDMAK